MRRPTLQRKGSSSPRPFHAITVQNRRKRFHKPYTIGITDGEPKQPPGSRSGNRRDKRTDPTCQPHPHTRSQTIADVAARAGVSLATVSRVMNGNPSVDEALAEKVRAAAEELNYSASPLARSLVLGKTNTVAAVVPDLENPTFHGVLRGPSRAAARDGYHILIADSAESVAEERILAVETRRRCDGIVLCAPRMTDADLRRLLKELKPVVLVNREARSSGTPMIAADYQTGLSELLDLLYGYGHRSLVYPPARRRAHRMLVGSQRCAIFSMSIRTQRFRSCPCGVNFSDGYAAVERVLGSSATGVLAFNDLVAIGLMSALSERGLSVPGHMSVVGFDDIPFALAI